MFRMLSRMFRVIRALSAVAGLLFTAFLLGVRSPSDVRAMAVTAATALREATRPSDAALGCAAIEKELVATMSAPAIQGLASNAGAAAQKNFAALQKDGPMTGQMAATIAASLAREVHSNQTGALAGILPQLARSERLIGLGFTKQCSWTTGALPFAVPARPR